jgi:uncharacterized protein with HEPN domain
MSETTLTQAVNNSILDLRERLDIAKAVRGFQKFEGADELLGSLLASITMQLEIDVVGETTEDIIGEISDTLADIEYESKIFLQIPRLIESLEKIDSDPHDLEGLANILCQLDTKLTEVLKLEEYLSK